MSSRLSLNLPMDSIDVLLPSRSSRGSDIKVVMLYIGWLQLGSTGIERILRKASKGEDLCAKARLASGFLFFFSKKKKASKFFSRPEK